MYFYVAKAALYPKRRKNFFSLQFSFPLQKQHFASLERIGVPPKEEKCHFSFFLIKRHFCMYFYVPFHFLKLFFNSTSVAKAAFCKSRHLFFCNRIGVPQEEEKCHISFSLIRRHFSSLERIGVPPKEEKCHFSFFLIKHGIFVMYFYVYPQRRKNVSLF